MLSKAERRALRQAYRAAPSRELERLLLDDEKKRRPRSPGEVRQLLFHVVGVYCDPLAGRITIAECIKRQSAKEPSGRGKNYPIHEGCRACVLRDIHRAMSPGFVPAPYRVNPNRLRKQRAAMGRAAQRGEFVRVPSMDEPPYEGG